jgi:hypothetical protein
MLVAHERHVDRPFEEVVERLERLFPVLHRVASGAFSDERLADVRLDIGTGEHRLSKQVRLRWSVPIVDEERWMVSLAWSATGTSVIFPRMDADLSAIADDAGSLIRFRGNYEPPLGHLGEALDRAGFHHVAEATVENFIDQLIEKLEAHRDGD